jgi:hypothetical protein
MTCRARRASAVLIAVVFLIAQAARPAAAQVNSAVIEVLVRDPDGRALANVVVTAVNPESGATVDARTGDAGTVRLPAVPPGVYEVRFSLQGRIPLVEKDVTLRVGQTIVVHATMRAQPTEAVTVVGAPRLMDVHKSDSSANIVPEQIANLPVFDRDFQRLAFIVPTVQRERGEFRFISGGPVLSSGGNASQSTILVDGVDFTDPALGLATARFSQDAIREFRVISNRFDAEVGGSAGGALSVVTRSGTNIWTGSGFAFFRDDALRAQGALEQGKVPYGRSQFGAFAGGPLAVNRSHVFLSIEQINENNIALFRPGGAHAGQAADIEVPVRQTLGFGRMDQQFTPAQRLSGKFVYERYRQKNFRVGGTQAPSYGQDLDRDNWNLNLEHNWALDQGSLNQVHVQVAGRRYFEPRNSTDVAEWFSSGNTLRTGGNVLGDLLGDGTIFEIRDTYFIQRGTHFIRAGGAVQQVNDRSRIEFYLSGLFIYVTDTNALPLAYAFGDGSGDVTASTTRLTGYLQDDWAATPNLRISLGVRYDVDTKGNNPGFRHPLVPEGRPVDRNNVQPRAAFSWDIGADGRHVVRGGAGLFTGRYLFTPLFQELQQNGVTGRLVQTRINGALLGLPALALDPANPRTTGIPQKVDISIMAPTLVAPSATQISGGYTTRVGATSLYADVEGIYIGGRDEIIIRDANFAGNATPGRPNPAFNQINTYTNDGRSRYAALVMSLNGEIGAHLFTASYTFAHKKNIADDFSPELPFGFPNDPADIEAEYGRARSDERHRVVISGVFRLPYTLTVAPIVEYGSGQPWTHRRGYDFNGDGRNSDRPDGIGRFGEDGPSFSQVSVRVSKAIQRGKMRLDLIAEAFNLFNTRNDNVATIDGAEFLSGPTLAAPSAPLVQNVNFGKASATLPSREIQLGIRFTF